MMNKKILSIVFCTLLIATAIPVIGSINNKRGIISFENNNVQPCSLENWNEIQILLASDGEINDQFGGCVSIDGDYAVIGALGDDDYGEASGAAYVFKRSGSTWIEQHKLTASDGASMDFFGCSVSIYGDYIIVGAERDDDNGIGTGSAYVFKRSDSTWIEEQKLTASDGASMDEFGCSVSLYENYAIIGASYNGNGKAYVFKRSGSTWIEEQKLTASDGEYGDDFGWSVSLDGDYILIGAPGNDDYGDDSGAAYIFTYSGSTWIEQVKLNDTNGAESDWFGLHVAINGDYAVVGAHLDDNYDSTGSVFIFKRSGSIWNEVQKLNISNSIAFGWYVSCDVDNIIVASIADNDNEGAAYIYRYDDTSSSWIFVQKITASDGASTEGFGESVSISGDYAVVGNSNRMDDRGSVYVFIKVENQPPSAPTINGPTKGLPFFFSYPFTFISTDPEGDDVSYYIEWGDGKKTDWTSYHPSGSPGYTESHNWLGIGKYTIKAKAKDTFGLESPWTEFSFSTPRNRAFDNPIFRFLENNPLLFKIFQLLFKQFKV